MIYFKSSLMIENMSRQLVSVEQIRGARGLLGWSQTQLANAAGLSLPTVIRYETGGAKVSQEAVDKMRAALESAGVVFVDENGGGAGIRLKKPKK